MRINRVMALVSTGVVLAAIGLAVAFFPSGQSGRPTAVEAVDMWRPPSPASLIEAALPPGRSALREFYQARGFAPAWTGNDGLLPDAKAALQLLNEAPAEGLNASYAVAPLTPGADAKTRSAFDIAVSEALLRYARDVRLGQVDPTAVYGANAVEIRARQYDPLDAVARFARSGDVTAFLTELEPAASDYRLLKTALARYRTIAAGGGWPVVSARHDSADLSERLRREGYLAAGPVNAAALALALKTYQQRNGLTPSGVADPATIQALNVPAETRAAQIAANMERWRWLPEQLGQRYIMVNVADASLNYVEDGAVALTSRVVVGQPDKQTPLLETKAVAVTVNPVWHVPTSIVRNELQDKISSDDGYLESKHMTMKDGRVEQAPGDDNALGVLKFEMPDRLNIYLHDTPAKSAFRASVRDLSHGCVRVEQIRELGARALGTDPASLDELIATGQTLRRPVRTPLPVYINYWTALPGDNGVVGFRPDIYQRDEVLIKALQEKSSSRQT